MSGIAAILGAGVIGAGWAARFAVMGWQVRVFDPDPETADRVGEVLDRARRALPGLADVALPAEGSILHASTISQAVTGADWIQESVPDRLDLKRTLYQKVQEHCRDGVIIASSTSVFTPSALYGPSARRCPILVAQPVDPVYLLPLVELAADRETPPEVIARAREILTGIGMVPLQLSGETGGHISERLMDAALCEALWLLKDGVATAAEIDDAMRLGLGLNWAQMGPFETSRMAAGGGPAAEAVDALAERLAQVQPPMAAMPELTDELARSLAEPSNGQDGEIPQAERERHRDANLVALLRALKWANWGAGSHLRALDARLRPEEIDISRPIVTLDRAVPLDWTDYNAHMTEPRYMQAFSDATDRFMELVGCDADYIAGGMSFFTAESHIRHIAEAHAGQNIRVETTCLDGAGKKIHLFHQMFASETPLATGETLLIHVSLETRRSAPPGAEVARRLAEIAEAHALLPRPAGVGRSVGQRPD